MGIHHALPGFSTIFETPPMWVVEAFAQSAQLQPQCSATAPSPYRTLLQSPPAGIPGISLGCHPPR
eukprot:14922303-Heterocapsa_arctica.AAC.1